MDSSSADNDILNSLFIDRTYTRDDLFKIILDHHPAYTQSSCRWVLSALLKEGSLMRIYCGGYRKTTELKHYEPVSLEKHTSAALALLKKALPEAKIVAFDSAMLNEWLNELIAHSTGIIEMDPAFLEDAYYVLKAKYKGTVLLKPNEKEMTHYRNGETLLLEPLRSRAPLSRKENTIRLEKLMVDLLADDFFAYFYSASELPDIYESMSRNYALDVDTLFAYAKRRLVYDELCHLIPKDLIEEISTHDRTPKLRSRPYRRTS
jgi:hypothetical protein